MNKITRIALILVIGIMMLGYGGMCDQYSLTKSGSSGERPKPNEPTNLTAVGVAGARIDLNWIDNARVEDGFYLERSNDGANYALQSSLAADITGYSDTGLTMETTYYYRVKAFNATGESSYSNDVFAILLNAPGTLSATTVSSARIDLAWTDNSNHESGFKIERKTAVDGNYTAITTVAGADITAYSDISVTDGTSYYYRVSTYDATGESGYSNEASATTPINAPGALAANPVSPSQVNLTWTDNSNSEDGSKVERKTGAGGNYAAITTISTANITTYSDTGLIDGTVYYYRVQAYNATGDSAYCDETSATTPVSPPSALTTNVVSSSQIDLAWTDNSAVETGFKIERKIRAEGAYTPLTTTVGVNITSYSDAGLIDGEVYYYRVRAYNATGDSAYSNEASPAIPLNAPTNLAATMVSSSQIDLAWTDNSNNENGFKVERKPGVAGAYAPVTTIAGANLVVYSDTGLIDGTVYYYRVRAYNATTDSDYCNEASATTPINAPGALAANPVSPSQVNLTWTDNSNSEDGSKVERKTGAGGNYAAITTISTANITTYSDTGLADGMVYYYRVRAYNAAGDSDYCNETSATTPINPPSVLTATVISSSQVNLAWTDNSNSEDGFAVESSTNGITYTQRGTSGVNTYSDTSLTDGTVYYYRVKAYNSTGSSNPSNVTVTTTPLNAPSALNAVPASYSQINLAWTDNSNSESGFKVERKTGLAGAYTTITTIATAGITAYSDTGLADGTDYYYRVKAYNAISESSYCDEVPGTTPINPPSGLNIAVVSASQINLTWTDNSNNETGFKIERKDGAGSFTQVALVGANTTSYPNTGLIDGTAYYYRVRATNATGDSAYSNEPSATTPINAPSGLTGTAVSFTQINVSWTDNSGSETGYKIERRTAATNYALLTTVVANTSTYSDKSISAFTVYYYRVRSYNTAAGDSAYSHETSTMGTISNGNGGVWLYLKPITVTNSGSVLTDYPVSISPFNDPAFIDNTDLVGSWHFSESVGTATLDMSGNGNSGSLATGTSRVTGRFGRAISFDGAQGYISIPDANSLDVAVNTLTLEAWVYPTTNTTSATIINKEDSYAIYLNNGLFQAAVETADGGTWTTGGSTTVPLNEWSHLAFVHNNTTWKFYRNGAEVESIAPAGSQTGNVTPSNLALGIGARYNTGTWGSFFAGTIDEVKIYKRALPLSEIQARYNSGTPKVRHDYADIRVTDQTLTEELSCYQETDNKFWVKIPSLPNGDTVIKMFYGNPLATSTCNIADPFTFGDDFSGTTINSTEWVELDTKDAIRQDNKLDLYEITYNWDSALISIDTWPRADGLTLFGRFVPANAASQHNMMVGWENNQTTDSSPTQLVHGLYFNQGNLSVYENGIQYAPNGPATTYAANTCYDFRIRLKATGANYEIKGGAYGSWTIVYNGTGGDWATTPMRIAVTEFAHPGCISNLFIYTVASAEPTVSAPGSQSQLNVISNLVATVVSGTQIDLSFNENSSSELGFRVERSPDGTNYSTITTLNPSVTSYSDTTVTATNTYYYRVVAYDAAGDDPYGGQIVSRTAAPDAPSNFTAVSVTASAISLQWQDNSINETNFQMEYSTDGLGYSVTATLPANTASWTANGLPEGTTYYYKVKAYNAMGSNYSGVVSPTTLPNAPSVLSATAISWGQVNLSWTDNSNKETGFKIERKTGEAGVYTQIGTVGASVTSYSNNTGLSPETTYYYRVRAYTASVNSAYCTEVSATTLPPAWSQVVCGGSHTIALKSDGTLWTWGYNSDGQLGLGDTTYRTSPTRLGTATDWVAIGAGNAFSYAIKSNGTLWTWGDNWYGELGIGSSAYNGVYDKTSPVQVGIATDWTGAKIACGGQYIIAIKSNGTLWAWGYNSSGQLGLGHSTSWPPPATSPTRVGTDTDWAGAWGAGASHSFTIKSNSTLWSWGGNSYGQLGFGDTTQRISPTQLGSETNWSKVDPGGSYTIAKKSDGTLWACGYNTYGQLGLGDWNQRTSFEQIGSATNWNSFSTGGSHNVATKSDGTMWTWGENDYGGLGLGDTYPDRNIPTQVGSATDWMTVSAGGSFTAAIKADGTLWTWGYNNSGQLGLGDITSRSLPAQVAATPVAPSDLVASAVSALQINLTWVDNATNETGFKIERKEGTGGTYAQIATPSANTTSYNNTSGLTEGITYYYKVRAYNALGDSEYCTEAAATTLPAAPSNLAATPVSGTQIDLAWLDNSGIEDGFKIERKTGAGGTYAEIDTVGPYSNIYVGNDVIDRASYVYGTMTYMDRTNAVLQAGNLTSFQAYIKQSGGTIKLKIFRSNGTNWDLVGESGWFSVIGTGIQSYTISPSIVVQIGDYVGLTINGTSLQCQVDTDSTGGSHSYISGEVTGNTAKSTWTDNTWLISLKATIGSPSYSNSGLTEGTTYYYRVVAYKGATNSAYSNEVSATTGTASLSNAVDKADVAWSTGGDANWKNQSVTFYYDNDAAESGTITHSQTTWIETTIAGKGTLTFYWKVSSESGYDYLKFYVNGVEQTSISGEVDWEQKTYTSTTANAKIFKWVYSKDSSLDDGSDRGWLDKVVWTPQ